MAAANSTKTVHGCTGRKQAVLQHEAERDGLEAEPDSVLGVGS